MEADPLLFDRFKREQEIGEKLDHPGVMKVFKDDKRSRIYMVMEWVDGQLLRNLLSSERKFPPDRAAKMAARSAMRSITSTRTAWCIAI